MSQPSVPNGMGTLAAPHQEPGHGPSGGSGLAVLIVVVPAASRERHHSLEDLADLRGERDPVEAVTGQPNEIREAYGGDDLGRQLRTFRRRLALPPTPPKGTYRAALHSAPDFAGASIDFIIEAMTDERRYQDDEIAKIFEAAATPRASRGRSLSASSEEGLTLAELQDIGREVGVPPERIAEAASHLDLRRKDLPRQTHLGMPISVRRTVELPRAPTDREWGLLVTELRETFDAEGKDTSSAELREWSNGNLRACVEPTGGHYRLRMQTLKGDAVGANILGIFALLLGFVIVAVALSAGEAGDVVMGALFAAMGTGVLGFNVLRLPPWRREREEQMNHIAARARALIGEGSGPS